MLLFERSFVQLEDVWVVRNGYDEPTDQLG